MRALFFPHTLFLRALYAQILCACMCVLVRKSAVLCMPVVIECMLALFACSKCAGSAYATTSRAGRCSWWRWLCLCWRPAVGQRWSNIKLALSLQWACVGLALACAMFILPTVLSTYFRSGLLGHRVVALVTFMYPSVLARTRVSTLRVI